MSRHLISALALGALLATSIATPSFAFRRVMPSLVSDSDHPGPVMPDFKASIFGGPIKQKNAKVPKAVDPLKLIRNRMVSGETVSFKEMQQLADSGDALAQFNLAKRIEADNDPETLDAAARYYRRAAENGRTSAVHPLVRLLGAGVFEGQPKNLASSQALLEKLAAKGDSAARDGLTAMYRTGKPFGLDPARADALLVASAKGGDSKAALDLAFALLAGTPEPAEIDEAKGYLKIALASETLNVRTMAENLLRTLEPQLTAATETLE